MIDASKRLHPPRLAVLFVLATVPLLFGAVHPIVQSVYVCLVLVGLGGWLLSEATRRAWATPTHRVFLSTGSGDHPAALTNFLARGFRAYKTVRHTANLC